MKRFVVVAFALICIAIGLKAQSDVEKLFKEAEAKVKLADDNPNNARMQYDAASALAADELIKERADLDRAKKYASRAVDISLKEPVLKDTTLALSYDLLGNLFLREQSIENSFDFWELAIDAYEKELGRYDPVTIGSKLAYSNAIIMFGSPHKGFSLLLEAFNDNENAPENNRIVNMDKATLLFEIALEKLIAEQTERFRYALPEITYDGERYIIVQTIDWNIESPLVGWFTSKMLEEYGWPPKDDRDDYSIIIMNEETGEFRLIGNDEENRPQLDTGMRYYRSDPRKISFKEDCSYLKFFSKSIYDQIKDKYLEFKSKIDNSQK